MEHLTFKAVVTTTDQGLFKAVISAASVDREKDIVRPEAMVSALKAWEKTGKMIPLAWNHGSAPEDIIGHIDPSTAEKVGQEVVAEGFMDQSTAKGAEAWRLAKSGTLGFSFGYLITAGTNRKGGGRDIIGLDVFEITATPTPMNNDTRVLETKSTKALESDAREAIEEAGRAAYGSENTYVGVADYDPDAGFVVYCVSSNDTVGEETYTKVSYSTAEDGTVTLGDDAAEVTRQVTYQDKGADDLRRRSDRATFEVATRGIDLKSTPDETPSVTDVLLGRIAELEQAMKGLLETQAEQFAALEQATKSQARPADSLRKRSDMAVLEIQSDGASLRKPPQQVKEAPKPEPADELALRRESRNVMLELLTGGAA